MTGNPVKFVYVATGGSLPSDYPNTDTIYFLEESKEIRVGSVAMANIDESAIDAETLAEVLEAYAVKNVIIEGEGSTINNISFDDSTGRITVTKGNFPSIAKGVTPQPTESTLVPGGSFVVLTDTSVSGHTITDSKTKFVLPEQITDLEVTRSGNSLVFTLVKSDDSTVPTTFDELGSAAFANSTEFATAEQGRKADAAMPANGGNLTDATVTLNHDPVNNMEAATKQYVDNAVAGAASNLNFLGDSTTVITEGGTEAPTIDGVVVPISTLNKGDWVIYDSVQYIWDGSKWVSYGGSASGVPETRRVDSGYGLNGGGPLSADLTIAHNTLYTEDQSLTTTNFQVIDTLEYDKAGHISNVTTRDITTQVNDAITAVTTPIETSVSGLSDRVSAVESSVSSLTSTVDGLSTTVSGLSDTVDGLSTDLSALSTNLTNNYYTAAQVDSEISQATEDVLEGKIASGEEFQEMLNDVFAA